MTFDDQKKSGVQRFTFLLLMLTIALPLGVLTLGGAPAFADGDEEEEREEHAQSARRQVPPNAADTAAMTAIKNECGSCHIAYPANLLPAVSWQKIMGNLGDHFGTDASISDAALTTQMTNFLVKNAGDPSRTAQASSVKPSSLRKTDVRITETRWFIREHDEVGAGVWKRASIKSAANCGACHQGAADGNFSERNIRVPKQ